jgi:phenylalanine-4-hydroxylase
MATIVQPPSDFTALPEVPTGVFTAPLKRPTQVGEDWLEPRQREYSSDEDAIWNALFERQMEILPGRACSAFMAG